MDMMRGEEAEVMGWLARHAEQGPMMFILPGSHTKFVSLDAQARIDGCATTLAGELLQVLTHDTILAQSLDARFAETVKPDMVLTGAALAQKTGFGRACFCIRTLDQFLRCDANERANFLLGVVLHADLQALKNSRAVRMQGSTPLVVGGKGVLRQALLLLIEHDSFFSGRLSVIDDAQQALLAGRGAIGIAAARGLTPSNR